MLHTGNGSVAKGDKAMDDVALSEREGPGNLLVCEASPAGIQAERLGKNNQFLAVIADLFFPFLALRCRYHQIILHAGELSVGGDEQAVEGLGLIQNQLDVQPVLLIDALDGSPKRGRLGRLNGLVQICPHGMPCLDCFYEFHCQFVILTKITKIPAPTKRQVNLPLRLRWSALETATSASCRSRLTW